MFKILFFVSILMVSFLISKNSNAEGEMAKSEERQLFKPVFPAEGPPASACVAPYMQGTKVDDTPSTGGEGTIKTTVGQ